MSVTTDWAQSDGDVRGLTDPDRQLPWAVSHSQAACSRGAYLVPYCSEGQQGLPRGEPTEGSEFRGQGGGPR